MIEKYFKLGVRFRWHKPQNVDGPRDGHLTDSIRPTQPLTYIGLGEVVDPMLMVTHVHTIGLQMNAPIPHQWLDYTPGRTAKVPMGPYDVLTGLMTGCIIARWNDRGTQYVGHVGTVESDPMVNREVKRTFAFAMPKGTTGFNPADAWSLGDMMTLMSKVGVGRPPAILGLVTTHGEFYSVAVLDKGGNEWYCLGCKRVQPMPHDTLKMFMLRVD